MKKYKLKVKFIPYCDFLPINEHYVLKRRYLGFFWKTKKYFYCGEYQDSKTLEQAKQKALNYMNNYCQMLIIEKQEKQDLLEAYKEQRKWEKNETVYKTCECDK